MVEFIFRTLGLDIATPDLGGKAFTKQAAGPPNQGVRPMKHRTACCFALVLLATSQARGETASGGNSVTLYGIIDVGVSYVSNESGRSNVKYDDGIYTPSLFGIKGNENLGDGLHAVFNLVDQFNSGTGQVVQSGTIFGRNAYVGLDSDRLGTLTFGNQYDFMDDSLIFGFDDAALLVGGLYNFRAGPFSKIAIPSDPPFAPQFNWDRMANASVTNSVKYQSPEFGGFKFGALYGFGGVAGSFGAGSTVSFGANYDHGPFGAGAAYTEVKYVVAGEPIVPVRNWGVGAHYHFEKAILTALITTVRNSYNGGAIAEGEVGGTYLITPSWGLGADYMYMKGDTYLNNNHAHQITVNLANYLSKRTTVYAEAVYQRTNSGAQALINGVLDPDGTSSGPSQFIGRLGIQTSF
jgi:predicted porin